MITYIFFNSGYMAPEYAMFGQYSVKSDVFSFGVLILEIITGRRSMGSFNDHEQSFSLLDLVSLTMHIISYYDELQTVKVV